MRLPAVLVYTVLRLLAFLVPFGVMMLFPIFQEFPWLAAVFAALIGLSLSLLFLRRPLAEVSQRVEDRTAGRPRPVDHAEDVEDAAADAAASTSPESSGTAAEASLPEDPR